MTQNPKIKFCKSKYENNKPNKNLLPEKCSILLLASSDPNFDENMYNIIDIEQIYNITKSKKLGRRTFLL
jgi:CRISPR/Cas system endoribonuclease Cas6 (RAMP superfamily)